MNSWNGTGRITRDLDLKYTNSNKAVLKFGIAVDRKYKKGEADFFNCEAWEKTAELIVKYMAKGSKIGISGRLTSGSYDRADGTKVYTTDIVVEDVTFLDSKKAVNEDSEPVAIDENEDVLPF